MPIRSRLPSPRHLPAAAVAVLVAALGLLGILRWIGQPSTVVGDAEWIWAEFDSGQVSEVAFYLVREFEVEAPTGLERLWVQGDREYLLWLNGRRVGSGTFSLGEGVDEYDAGAWLRAGTNRLVAEVKSLKGQGGFLLALGVPGEEPDLVSDPSWKVISTGVEGLIEGWAPLLPTGQASGADGAGLGVESSSPYSWGRPPTGRWGHLGPERRFPLWSDRFFFRPRALGLAVGASEEARVAGEVQVFDFQREVVGWIGVRFLEPNESGPTAAFVAGRRVVPPPPAELRVWMSERYQTVALAPARTNQWRDSVPRRFRWVVVAGDQPVEEVWVDLIQENEGFAVEAPQLRSGGLFGISVPPVITTVEARLRGLLREPAVTPPTP